MALVGSGSRFIPGVVLPQEGISKYGEDGSDWLLLLSQRLGHDGHFPG